jgi:lipocalin
MAAWITVDQFFADHKCDVIDVSDDGGQISIDAETDLPKRFLLRRTPNGSMAACDVVWRRGRIVGFKFS